jgi:hypothetical protein
VWLINLYQRQIKFQTEGFKEEQFSYMKSKDLEVPKEAQPTLLAFKFFQWAS